MSRRGMCLRSDVVLDLPARRNNPRNSEGSFVALKDGRIMFAWSRYRGGSWADEARADIAARYSSDGGMTWTGKDRILVEHEGDRNVMSCSLLRLHDGRIALFYLRKNNSIDCRPWMRTSDDEGKTWSEPSLCIPGPGYFCLLNDQAVQLKSGRIILPASYHRGLTEPSAHDVRIDSRGSIVFHLSDDAGKTWREAKDWWTLPVRSQSGMHEPGIVELNNGKLYCYARTGIGHQWQMTSDDQGETWSPPERSRFRSPLSPMNIKRIPQTGDLLAVWNDLTPGWGVPKKKLDGGWAHNDKSWGRTPLVAAISGDEGRTWRHAKAIENDPDRGFCYIANHFTDDAVLLGYCCGGGGKSHVLQDLCVRRIELEELYANRG